MIKETRAPNQNRIKRQFKRSEPSRFTSTETSAREFLPQLLLKKNQYKNSIATDINPKSQQAKESVKKNMQVYADKKKELTQTEKEE